MSVHVFHDRLPGFDPGNVLHDGCPECEERAAKPLSGLTRVDDTNFLQLWQDMLAEKMGGHPLSRDVSVCDTQLLNALYLIAVLLERNAGIDPHTMGRWIVNTRNELHAELRARLAL